MNISAAILFSRIPPFFRHLKDGALWIVLFVCFMILYLSFYYWVEVDKIKHKKIEITVNGTNAYGHKGIDRLEILIGINQNISYINSSKNGCLAISILPDEDKIRQLVPSEDWRKKYQKDIQYVSEVKIESNFPLPIPNYFRDSLGVQFIKEILPPGFGGQIYAYTDVICLSDTCVKFNQLWVKDQRMDGSLFYTFSDDIATTSKSSWYKPANEAIISFSLKLHSKSNIESAGVVIAYASPLNFMTIYPEPDDLTPERVVYKDSLKMKKIMREGIYILAQDITKLHNNNLKSFWSATIIGASISTIAEVIFKMIERKRKKTIKKIKR